MANDEIGIWNGKAWQYSPIKTFDASPYRHRLTIELKSGVKIRFAGAYTLYQIGQMIEDARTVPGRTKDGGQDGGPVYL